MGDARIDWSLRIGRRIRERLADDQAVPVGRWALRWVHSRLGEDLSLLDAACDDQAFASAGRVGLVASSPDVMEAGVALEAWDLFMERWVSPAWGRQLSPKRLMTGYLAYVAALDAGALVQRTEAREPGALPPRRGAETSTIASRRGWPTGSSTCHCPTSTGPRTPIG